MTATKGDKGTKGETGTCRACGRDVELTFIPGRRDIGLQAHWYGMCKLHWSEVEVLDSDGETPLYDHDSVAALREYRRTGAIAQRFLARVGSPTEDPDDASTWGPAVDEIDWTGFPEETEE